MTVDCTGRSSCACGQWAEAESEVARICDDVSSWHVGHAGIAHHELGQVALLKGDFELAASEFEAASRLGHSPQPGLATLRLLNGEVERAAVELREALRVTADPCPRIALLAVAVEISVALGELARAGTECDELMVLVATFSAPPQRARAAHARGVHLLAMGDADAARGALTDALGLWGEAAAPYEAARVRMTLGAAELALGEPAGHALHLEHALSVFERLGAMADARHAAALIGRPLHSARVERALMFTDIEASTDLLARLGDDRWIELLRSHDVLLRRLFVQHRGHEIHQKGGGDGFFVVFNSPDSALDCAIAIQETLHREQVAVAVRIGVHWAEVTHAEGDFSGRGVHEAARISALASGGEILVSAATLAVATKLYATAAERMVELRGLPGPFDIASISYAE